MRLVAAGAEVSRLLQLATSSSIIKFILSAALKCAKLSFCIKVERIQVEVCTEVAKSPPHRISSDFPKAFASLHINEVLQTLAPFTYYSF